MKTRILGSLAIAAIATSCLAQVGQPQNAGLTPRTATIDVNTNQVINLGNLETGDISITANGNVVLAFEDDGAGLTDWEAIWTLYDSQGHLLTPAVTITNLLTPLCFPDPDSVANCTYRAFFRSDGSPTPGYTASFGGKAKGNQFGNGFAWCGGAESIGCEIPELLIINLEQGDSVAASFPVVQLLNNDGSPNRAAGGPSVAGILSFSDADMEPAGAVRPGDIDFLANGNFVIVGESRQADDRALTGQASGNVVVYKVLNSTGGVVKAYSAASSEASGQDMWHGTAATANGFAIRFNVGTERIRLFDNNGNPLGTNIDIAAVTGHPEAGQGGRGDGTGFKSNGKDAFVYAVDSSSGPWITVFNADGTVRYSRAATETNADGTFVNSDRLDAAIAEDGRVIVAFDASNNDTNNANLFNLPQARVFDPCGNPMGPVFYLSERENPTNAISGDGSTCRPRVAWRGNTIAVLWGSRNCPDPNFPTDVVALRLFSAGNLPPINPVVPSVGVVPKTATFDVNTNFNNGSTESLGVGIAANGNVFIAWEDDSVDGQLDYWGAAGAFYSSSGTLLTTPVVVTNYNGANSLTVPYVGWYRDNGTPAPAHVAWGPKIHANLFGNGIGNGGSASAGLDAGSVPFGMGFEVPRLLGTHDDNNNSGADFGDFPAVQLLNNDGSKAANVLSGATEVNAEPQGSIRIGDWEYLSNGNIAIVGESRQVADRALTGQASGNVPVLRVVKPDGTEVKGYAAVSSSTNAGDMWHGVGATANGFAVRFNDGGVASVRLFDNAGNPTTANINLATLTGRPEAGSGGRGDGTGFHGNGKDAYVYANSGNPGTGNTPQVTVLNADGTLRWSRAVGDPGDLPASDRLDAAIAPNGQVIVVFDDNRAAGFRLPYARLFDRNGNPSGGILAVSERDDVANALGEGRRPRVAWRGNQIAIAWESLSSPVLAGRVVAGRLFDVYATNELHIAVSAPNVSLSWRGNGILQSSLSLTGPYCDIGGSSPVSRPVARQQEYFRLRAP